MFIDYIYLLLILTLICSILFLIYLSYEYRINEGFTNEPIPTIQTTSIYNLENNISPNNNDYNLFINQRTNQLLNYDNLHNLELLEKSKKNLETSKFLENLKIGNNTLDPNTIYPVDSIIKTIKSKYNSQYLSTFANDASTYGVLVNDKCMTVNGLCKEDYCLLECKNNLYSSDTQKFTTKRIYSDSDAAKAMNLPISSISNDNVYPFNIFSSVVNNKCLTIGDGGLTIEKCNLNNIKQQWSISPDANICLID